MSPSKTTTFDNFMYTRGFGLPAPFNEVEIFSPRAKNAKDAGIREDPLCVDLGLIALNVRSL